MEKNNRIVILWILVITGFLTHTLADLMPAFWGESVAAMEGPAPAGMVAFMMSFTYIVPALGILLVSYCKGRGGRIANAILACVIGLFCIFHMAELLEGSCLAQYFILPVMAVVGVLLAVESVKYCKK